MHTYKEVYVDNIRLWADGTCSRQNSHKHHVREVINKMACFAEDVDLLSEIYEETSDTSFAPGSSLYVASECKTGRDTFRNSGYSITRMRDRADVIIVPDIRDKYYYTLECNIVAYDEAKDFLHLVNVNRPGYADDSQFTLDEIARVRGYLKNAFNLDPDCVDNTYIKVWFIPKCDEIKEILAGNKLNVPYCQESMVPVKAPTQISPETLVFWENINDENLLARTICQSNWMEYPTTLLIFLKFFKAGRNWFIYANEDFRRILKNIGFEHYSDLKYLITDKRIIGPKDYAMFQSYMLYKFGVREKGGNIMANRFELLPQCLKNLMRRTVLVKPMDIPGGMKLGDIRGLTGL